MSASTHGKSGHFKANCCRVRCVEYVTAILSDAVLGRAERVVPAGTTLNAYSETEFSNEVHEPVFKLENGLELSIPAPELVGPTTRTLTLEPLPPGSHPCYSLRFAASSENKNPKLLELSGCVRVSGS